MSAVEPSQLARREVLRGDLVYGSHLFLACSMALWRMLEATPQVSAAYGGTYASSLFGRGLAVVTVLGGVAALVVIALWSLPAWRNWKLAVLFVALCLAAGLRRQVDVFDLSYLALTAILAVLWFWRERVEWRARVQT